MRRLPDLPGGSEGGHRGAGGLCAAAGGEFLCGRGAADVFAAGKAAAAYCRGDDEGGAPQPVRCAGSDAGGDSADCEPSTGDCTVRRVPAGTEGRADYALGKHGDFRAGCGGTRRPVICGDCERGGGAQFRADCAGEKHTDQQCQYDTLPDSFAH